MIIFLCLEQLCKISSKSGHNFLNDLTEWLSQIHRWEFLGFFWSCDPRRISLKNYLLCLL